MSADHGTDVESPVGGMSFLSHLEELRRRLFLSFIGLVIGAIAVYFVSQYILDFLTRPVERLVFLSPPEAFMTRLKVALIGGAVLASPFIFYQFWRFVRPALRPREARFVTSAVLSCSLFLLGGLAFGLLLIVPIGIRFLLSFGTAKLEPMLSIDRYVTFVSHILLASALVFQLPVVLFFLTKFGIVNPKRLRKARPWAVVILAVVSAVLTPPDVFTQLLMLGPLIALYEVGIVGSVLAARRQKGDRPE